MISLGSIHDWLNFDIKLDILGVLFYKLWF